MSFEKLLNKLATIQTKSTAQNATGSVTESWANTYTNVKCRYNRAGNGRQSAGTYQVTLEDFVFYFKVDQVITIADRIVVDGKTFVVDHVFQDGSAHHIEAFAKLKSFD
jgi:head-tail adaptor